jgi:hypothetical protein
MIGCVSNGMLDGIKNGIKVGSLTTAVSMSVWAVMPEPAQAQRFYDTGGHWASAYIDALAGAGVINGFPDGTFRPNQPVTRAQFATIVNGGFQLSNTVGMTSFWDVPPSHWASRAISTAAANNLVAGFPDGSYRPEQPVTRTEALVVLVNGLGSGGLGFQQAGNTQDLFSRYRDAAAIPGWATPSLALASQSGLIVNYPDPMLLEPNRAATRAEIAAFTYQAMAQRGSFGSVGQAPTTPTFEVQVSTVAAGTLIPVVSTAADRLLIAPNETRPVSMIVQNPIRNTRGDIVIPFGSRVDGRFEPAVGGTRFVADTVIIDNQVFSLVAQSDVIHDVKDPRQTNTGQVVQDAAIGAAAGAILGLVTGDRAIATEEVLAAGVAGAAVGNITAPRVSIIDPNQAITIRLMQDLTPAR